MAWPNGTVDQASSTPLSGGRGTHPVVEPGQNLAHRLWHEVPPRAQELAGLEVEPPHVHAQRVHLLARPPVLRLPQLVLDPLVTPALRPLQCRCLHLGDLFSAKQNVKLDIMLPRLNAPHMPLLIIHLEAGVCACRAPPELQTALPFGKPAGAMLIIASNEAVWRRRRAEVVCRPHLASY